MKYPLFRTGMVYFHLNDRDIWPSGSAHKIVHFRIWQSTLVSYAVLLGQSSAFVWPITFTFIDGLLKLGLRRRVVHEGNAEQSGGALDRLIWKIQKLYTSKTFLNCWLSIIQIILELSSSWNWFAITLIAAVEVDRPSMTSKLITKSFTPSAKNSAV